MEAEEQNNSSNTTNNHLFPVFLKLEDLSVLLVGAGKVGLEKLTSLLTNSPSTPVHIVATEVSDDVRKLAASHPNVIIEKRNFHPVD
ncbi:MAG TPA: NAD(P)-dependent oxidoreductase, partial [Chitinophagaceae bacterium]|nr:NAD(P)-dependent oxidoreductase [Chitinophagaceae bacterium]